MSFFGLVSQADTQVRQLICVYFDRFIVIKSIGNPSVLGIV